ncbi:MAG: hypothetical protein JHD16_07855 [Solirubrobacteraceae bacterium]|nr:hypothetical protein [Solirubrobacteraceae bacterium]
MAPRPTKRRREPDIAVFIAMIAAAAITTMAELALVIAWPIFWVWVAGLLPVVFWALLLREMHRFLAVSGEDDA